MSPGFGRSPMHLTGSVTDAITGAARFLHRGPAHRRRLELADVRIAVVGTRDRTLVTHTLSDVFDTRGYDTYTNVADRDTVLFGDDGPEIGRASCRERV